MSREDYKFDPFKVIKKTAEKAGSGIKKTAEKAGSGIKDTAEKAGKGIKSLPNTIKSKALAPIGNFFKKIWDWFKYVISVVCCVCIGSACFMMGIPQMLVGIVSSASQSTPGYSGVTQRSFEGTTQGYDGQQT